MLKDEERARELADLAKWILVNRHCMIGHDCENSLEKICYCGWRGIGLLAHSQHEADERVKEIVERLTQLQAEARIAALEEAAQYFLSDDYIDNQHGIGGPIDLATLVRDLKNAHSKP